MLSRLTIRSLRTSPWLRGPDKIMVEERDRNLMNNAISSRSDVYSHFLSGWDMKEMAEREKREKASREKSKQEDTVVDGLDAKTSDIAKCSSKSRPGDLNSPFSSSIDADKSDASGDESEGEDSVSDGLDAKTRDQYIVKEARKRLAAEGAAPVSMKAFDSLERHLLLRSGVKGSMAPLSVSLFNFHSQHFAQRILDKSMGNLVLVESALEYSMKAKEFSRSARRKGHRVEAFHAGATALFGLERKKKEETGGAFRRKKKVPLFSFPDQLVARPKDDNEDGTVVPLKLRTKGSRPLTTVLSPIIICPLGAHTQQMAVLDAMLRSVLQHHLNIDERGLFALGDVELLTYLHAEQASHLLSSALPSLSFVSHAARRKSQLMHALFEIGHLKTTLSSSSFSPHNLQPTKKMAHAKKMKEVGFSSSRWFGCWLRPRSTVSIGGREIESRVIEDEEENDSLASLATDRIAPTLPPSVLLPYAVWCETLGKMPATKKAADVLSTLIPASAAAVRSIIPDGAKIGEVSLEDTEAVFVEALAELSESPSVLQYYEKHLMKSEDKVNFAD